MKYALIMERDDQPRLIRVCPSLKSLRDELCQQLFGCLASDLRDDNKVEFDDQWAEFHVEGFLRFEGDPGVQWGVIE